MLQPYAPPQDPLTIMADGTIKQLHPFSGTEVWTVPGRGHRPLGVAATDPVPLDPDRAGRHCAFCELRYAETPPEKSRLVARPGPGGTTRWESIEAIPAEDRDASIADFRRIPNLFEIVSFAYWRANYHYEPSPRAAAHQRAYLASEAGRAHVLAVVRQRHRAGGGTEADWQRLTDDERIAAAAGFFAGGHDVIVARRHYVDGATHDDEPASSGTLTPQEHEKYVTFTIDTMTSLYEENRYARYVVAFQNWLKPAGASFDHLHKQVVAIDERGVQIELELQRLRANANLYNELGVDYAARRNLLVAENEHAVAFAGFGHRYPTLEVYGKSPRTRPWEQTDDERRGMSDVVHALHAATGPSIPCNEEWQHQPPDCDIPMPWRVLLKWRVSTLAGFEGGTRVYLNTIDPWALRDRVVPRLAELARAGTIAPGIAIGSDCPGRPNSLRYHGALRG